MPVVGYYFGYFTWHRKLKTLERELLHSPQLGKESRSFALPHPRLSGPVLRVFPVFSAEAASEFILPGFGYHHRHHLHFHKACHFWLPPQVSSHFKPDLKPMRTCHCRHPLFPCRRTCRTWPLRVHIVCRRIVTIYDANQDAANGPARLACAV